MTCPDCQRELLAFADRVVGVFCIDCVRAMVGETEAFPLAFRRPFVDQVDAVGKPILREELDSGAARGT